MITAPLLERRLADLVAKHGVPAASVAVYADGETVRAAVGTLNMGTGVEATADSVFQIGSVTKAYTATLVLRLVEQGLVVLDQPVVQYLPELRLADDDVTARVTLRHLLSHTSGIDGDNFADTGRGDDALERYVETCQESEQSLPLGAAFSYCNTGYGIAGRLVEKVTGMTWDDALRRHVLEPLGVTSTVTLPEEAIRFRVAYGHVPGPDGQAVMAPYWAVPRSSGPAGGITATAADVLAFARAHLLGSGPLGGDTVRLMRTPVVTVPDPSLGATHWGLGLLLLNPDGRVVVGHEGGTVGQSGFVRWVPDAGVAVALLGNGGDMGAVRDQLLGELLDELAGVQLPPPVVATGDPLPADIDTWLGTYERTNFRLSVERREDSLHGTVELAGLAAAALGASTFEGALLPAGPDRFVTSMLTPTGTMPVVFFRAPDGTRYCHMGGRAQRRVDDA